MIMTSGLTSTGNEMCATPQEFYNWISRIFNFTLDVCALPENAKCKCFYSPAEDGLSQPWTGGVWCNPPYGREIGRWVRRACEECEKPYNNFIVMLLPARTDTRWFHDYVYGKARLLFLDGRLKFGEMKTGAPFPSMIAIYARRH